MPYVKIRLTETGMDSFNGDIAGEKFENGISVEAMPLNMADRIAALMPAVIIDSETGEDLHQAGISHRLISASAVPCVVEPKMRAATEEELAAERMRQAARNGKKVKLFSVEELESIAAAEGIDGLREIAKPWNVKAREISKLIGLLLKAQRDYIAVCDQVELEKQEQRKRAEAESIAREQKRQREIIEEGKHWSPEIE
jgi:hypothetical protein